jgi:two-component system sensor histidine kinase/response regulator
MGGMIQRAHCSTDAALIDSRMLARVDGDRELLTEVIELFLEDGPMHIETMRRALAGDDSEAVRRAAHALAGAASNFDAANVTALARGLEAETLAGNLAASKELFGPLQSAVSQMVDRLVRIRSALACAS